MNNEDETMNECEGAPGVALSTGSRFYAALVSHGVPALVAAAIIGAAYAVLVAWGVLGAPGEDGAPVHVDEVSQEG